MSNRVWLILIVAASAWAWAVGLGSHAKGDPALIVFSAEWCAPCQKMAPIVEQIEDRGYPVRRVNFDTLRPLAESFGVQKIPAFVLVDEGREITRREGVMSPAELVAMFGSWQPTQAIQMRAATVQISNRMGQTICGGSGTFIQHDGATGIVVTCQHLFRQGVGSLEVVFRSGVRCPAKLLGKDDTWDVAVLEIANPPAVEPMPLIDHVPQRGDQLYMAGYGDRGKPLVAPGSVVQFVMPEGQQAAEWYEISGLAREGDSGGSVFTSRGELVGVLTATNCRKVTVTCCRPILNLLRRVCPRFRLRKQLPAQAPGAEVPGPEAYQPPMAEVPPRETEPQPPARDPRETGQAELDALKARLAADRAELEARIVAAEKARRDALAELDRLKAAPPIATPPIVQPPAATSPVKPLAEAAESAASGWLTAKGVGLLVGLGVPGGIAALAAGGATWLIMRRGKKRLAEQISQLQQKRTQESEDARQSNLDASHKAINEAIAIVRQHSTLDPPPPSEPQRVAVVKQADLKVARVPTADDHLGFLIDALKTEAEYEPNHAPVIERIMSMYHARKNGAPKQETLREKRPLGSTLGWRDPEKSPE